MELKHTCKIIAVLLTKEPCDSLSISSNSTHPDQRVEDAWHAFVHADLDDCLAADRRHSPDRLYPSLRALTNENAQHLRRLRPVSRAFAKSVQRLLRQHQVLAVDLDRPASLHNALNLFQSRGAQSRSFQIIAGQRCTMPTCRFHTRDYSVHADLDLIEQQMLANYIEKPYDPGQVDNHMWPSSYRCLLPKPTDAQGQAYKSSWSDTKQLFLDLLRALQPGRIDAGRDSAPDGLDVASVALSESSLPLNSLAVVFPAATSYFDTYDEHSVNCWDLDAVGDLLTILRTELFGLHTELISPAHHVGLYPAGICDRLFDLRLELPCTRHFAVLFPSASQSSCASPLDVHETLLPVLFPSLRHLLIRITDSSGPSGDASYVGDEYAYNDLDEAAIDGTMTDAAMSGYPPSNLQIRYPNRGHQEDMWRFIASCRTIESLCVQASHFLGLDLLVDILREQQVLTERHVATDQAGIRQNANRDWTQSGLKHLSLARIYTDMASMLYILNPKADSPDVNNSPSSPIRRLNLDNVKIYAQRPFDPSDAAKPPPGWSRLFNYLADSSTCPDFEFLGISYLTYFTDHPSYGHVGRPNEDIADMWSEDDEDWKALRELAKSGAGNMHDERNRGREADGDARNLWMQGIDGEIMPAGCF